jgi:hypothetical protein
MRLPAPRANGDGDGDGELDILTRVRRFLHGRQEPERTPEGPTSDDDSSMEGRHHGDGNREELSASDCDETSGQHNPMHMDKSMDNSCEDDSEHETLTLTLDDMVTNMGHTGDAFDQQEAEADDAEGWDEAPGPAHDAVGQAPDKNFGIDWDGQHCEPYVPDHADECHDEPDTDHDGSWQHWVSQALGDSEAGPDIGPDIDDETTGHDLITDPDDDIDDKAAGADMIMDLNNNERSMVSLVPRPPPFPPPWHLRRQAA